MRTSDEKRREIAAELRAESERWRYYREDDNVFCMSDHEFAEAILDDFGFNDMDMPAYEFFGQMADIIDPTCHIVLKPSDSDFSDEPQYLCSRCGKAGIDVYERDDCTLAGIVDCANHCSYCGARVVRGDGD